MYPVFSIVLSISGSYPGIPEPIAGLLVVRKNNIDNSGNHKNFRHDSVICIDLLYNHKKIIIANRNCVISNILLFC